MTQKLNTDTVKYEDIIDLPYRKSTRHPQMSAHDRAAQFGAFAALTGHSDAISETARLNEEEMKRTLGVEIEEPC